MSLSELQASCVKHIPSTDPRRNGRCVRCGSKPEPEQLGRRRSVQFEREVKKEAARGFVDPSSLIEFSEFRASQPREYGDPDYVHPGRASLHEARCEMADGSNYLTWWLEDNVHLDDERKERVFEALRHVMIAYDLLEEQ